MENIKLVNLTPHDVNIVLKDGSILTIERTGAVARLSEETITVGSVNGIPITMTKYDLVEGLPDQETGTMYIVSAMVAKEVKGTRNDVLVPSETVRDDKGVIIGCKSLGIV